jgi:positive regulator of sigma E activity
LARLFILFAFFRFLLLDNYSRIFQNVDKLQVVFYNNYLGRKLTNLSRGFVLRVFIVGLDIKHMGLNSLKHCLKLLSLQGNCLATICNFLYLFNLLLLGLLLYLRDFIFNQSLLGIVLHHLCNHNLLILRAHHSFELERAQSDQGVKLVYFLFVDNSFETVLILGCLFINDL